MTKRKHQYALKQVGDSIYPIFECKHCKDRISLYEWQLKEMSLDMAICTSPEAPRIWIPFNMFSYNCLANKT